MNKDKFKIIISRSLLPLIINIYIKTLSIKFNNSLDNYENKIFVFWHCKMFIGWWIFRNRNFSAFVSESNDGEILANILRKWNYNLIRGSSSKGGKEALDRIVNDTESDKSVVITPDGPRGPAYELKNGALIISISKNYEIIPVKIHYNKKFLFKKSWDKFEIPLPFTKCYIRFGNTFNYHKYLYDEELIKFKKEICEEL
jgi:lysophospholipid acyltransferase (LPLAT)-like uncharacterized protein